MLKIRSVCCQCVGVVNSIGNTQKLVRPWCNGNIALSKTISAFWIPSTYLYVEVWDVIQR